MQLTYNHLFESFPDTSRVWVYQSQTPIAKKDQEDIYKKLKLFISGWATHGTDLFGGAEIIDDYFIILCVDENRVPASGCSIDTSVRFIKDLENAFDLKLFDRMHVLTEENGSKSIVHFSDLSKHPNAYVYNPMIQTLGELRNNWKIKISESTFA